MTDDNAQVDAPDAQDDAPEADPDEVNADLLAQVKRMKTVRLPRRAALEVLTNACCGDNGQYD